MSAMTLYRKMNSKVCQMMPITTAEQTQSIERARQSAVVSSIRYGKVQRQMGVDRIGSRD